MKLRDHKHTHSLYVHCLDCQMFGIPGEKETRDPEQAAECGNCRSMRTVKYYPGCCLVNGVEE